MDPNIVARFWGKVEKTEGCWLWQASTKSGYGQFSIRHGEIVLAHRLAYEITYGPIPEGRSNCICHTCDTPTCVNPAHLWLGTPANNTADMISKGRQGAVPREEKHHSARLTDEQIKCIRRLYATGEYRQSTLSRMFDIDQGHISRIVNNKKRKETRV